jgi:hypothetical protein
MLFAHDLARYPSRLHRYRTDIRNPEYHPVKRNMAEHDSHRAFYSGPYRARTDDIHGVNVALYQLS